MFVVAESSLHHSLKTVDKKDRVIMDELVCSSTGQNFHRNTSNCVYDYLSSPSHEILQIVLWHDLLNNTMISHSRKKNVPQTVEQLASTIKILQNPYCVVTSQRERERSRLIFNTPLQSVNYYIIEVTKHIISGSEQTDEATLTE